MPRRWIMVSRTETLLVAAALVSSLPCNAAQDASHDGRSTSAQSTGVDLVPVGIVPSATEPPKVFVFVQNRGERVVRGSFDVELWLDDQLLGRQRVDESVPARGQHSVKLLFMRPGTMATGLHNFMLKVDSGDTVRETNERNNVEISSVWFDDSGTQAPRPAQGRR